MATTSSGTATVTLPNDTQILITREFNAPAHLVYRAWTTPELVKRWWTAELGEATIADIDLRVGGAWRYVMTTGQGDEVVAHGEYREIVPNERIVSTEVYDVNYLDPGHHQQTLNTFTFTEVDGRTTVTILTQSQNNEELRTASFGMDGAMDELERVALSLR